jgi:phage terminase large subunit-like protein
MHLSRQYMQAAWEEFAGVRREEEIFGRRFNESAGASFRQAWLDRTRVDAAPELEAQIVSVDPAQSQNVGSDETGIVRLGRAKDGHVYVLRDETGKLSPEDWADRAVKAADPRAGGGGAISVERNHLGDAAASLIRSRATNAGLLVRVLGKEEPWPPVDKRCLFIREQWGRESKSTRAEGPAAETEAGRVHLVGDFAELETELTTYVPDAGIRSPNRFDAFVYGVIELRGLRTDAKRDRREDVAVAAVAQTRLTELIRRGPAKSVASAGPRTRYGL